MERVSASLIEEIRSALVERYNRDQEIQQMIEEIGAEEGLNEKELFVIHQAYLEVKERMQYTANLMELWNQIEAVQDRMGMLNSYESLERDLFGDVLSFDKPMGYGASNQDNLDYAMEQVKLHDVDHDIEDIDLSKEYPIDNQDAVYFNEHSANKKTTSSRNDINDDDEENDFDDESPLDRDIRTSLDPYDMVNSLLYSKQSTGDKDKTKQQKEIDKLIKKQLKRVEEEWAKLSGKKDKKDKKKKDKDKKKKDKQSKKEFELVKESKKSKKDKESKKSKKDKDSKKDKKDKDAKKDKKAKKLEKALKKESQKSTKKD
ncbi:hypothetical protein [Veillonella atypica]|jgi:hypothetical protein|uniref:Uncharacterized protein n=1 Tax=Veillonella atypica KON TaxID=1128111 RepID=A0ABP2SR57_9FIRM|nr:hypothetical protein [Veillonella atypica]EKY18766.1 hypothetical protein HMPREF0870_01328 [Veillonella atypica KON]MBF1751933.1 hypothetical protein [Veillonella sp.]PQL18084.1 hypothetical protein VAHSUH02_07640 [Veillonella atypica KON]SUP07654.1 Uncharacterised protein [Veillonella atypica]